MTSTKILFEVEEATKVKAQEKAKKDGISLTAILVNSLRSYNAGELELGLRWPMIKHIEKHAKRQLKTSWKDFIPEALKRIWVAQLEALNTIELNSEILLQNYRYLADASHKTLFPSLKGNAYGHGIEQVTSILMWESPKYYYVDSYYEALRIREVDEQARVLIGGYIPQENLPKIHLEWTTPIISDLQTLRTLASQKRDIKIHLKIDTGMHRAGLALSELWEAIRILDTSDNLDLEGVCTHFADADNHDMTVTNDQMNLFLEALQQIHNAGFAPKYSHLSNSAGIFKESIGNAARPGISLYGVNPLSQVDLYTSYYNPLSPCLKLTSRLVSVKELDKWEWISYNHTYHTSNALKVGTVPFGYHEWLPRSLSNTGYLSRKWKKLPILGRVCMNHVTVDLSEIGNASIEDEITIISGQKDGLSSIYEMAGLEGSIPYEVYTNLDSSIRRVII